MSGRGLIERRTRIFLGCEGESEQGYGRLLQEFADDEGRHVHLVIRNLRPPGNPLVLANKAVRLAGKEAQKAPLAGKAIMFDADGLGASPERGRKALKVLEQGGFIAVLQRPDYEGLLLRHFAGHERDDPPPGKSMSKLKSIWPAYHKNMSAADLRQQLSLEHVFRAAEVTTELRSLLRIMGLVHDGT